MNRTKKTITGMRVFLILTASALMLLSGCMSLSSAGETEISDILSLINEARHQQLSEMSSSPFLLDGEILQGRALSQSFWEGLSASGFTLNNPEIIRNEALTASDAAIFGNSNDVDIFFSKYIPENSVIIEISSDEGRTVMILSPEADGRRSISAWGGPY